MSDPKKRNMWLILAALLVVLVLAALLLPGVLRGGDDPTGDHGPGDLVYDPNKPTPDTGDDNTGQTGDNTGQTENNQTGNTNQTPKPPAGGAEAVDPLAQKGLRCTNFSLFSGQFVEDGRDELVEDVAAVLVTNTTDQFLDFGVLIYELDGETCTFVVTGLPAGESAWVMETLASTAGHDSELVYQDCITAFRSDNIAAPEGLEITSDGNMLSMTNTTEETLDGVFVYYKNRHSDGNFFGGITYRVGFAEMKPGETDEYLAGHFDPATSEIVRVTWE